MKQDYKKYLKAIADIIVLLTSIISVIISVIYNRHEGYNLLFLLPITFLILYFFIYRRVLFNEFRVFLTSFSIITYIRYVVMPIFIVISGYYEGRSIVSPSNDNYRNAILLMIYEFIVLSVVILLFESRYNKNRKLKIIKKEIELPKNKFMYLVFLGVTLLAVLIRPQALNMFSFIVPRMSGLDYLNTLSIDVAIVTYMLFTSKFLIYILIISYLYNKYKKSNNRIYKTFAFLATFINISIFYGLNRSDLVIPACASILLYMNLFKDKNIIKYAFIGVLIVFLISSIGVSRQLASISKNQSKIIDIADMIQGYFGGVYNVAISIETYQYYPEVRNISRVMYDTFRPFIGFNVFLKNSEMEPTNNFFNKRIYFNDHTAQIVPMVGQGYIHFGYILYIFHIL